MCHHVIPPAPYRPLRSTKTSIQSPGEGKAAEVARVVVGEARQIARRKDKTRAAGRTLRRAMNKLKGDL